MTIARQQPFARGTILVMDRGYLDFAWFAQLTEAGVFFVTRMKDGTAYEVVERRPVPSQGGVVTDKWIALGSAPSVGSTNGDSPCGASR